MRRQNFGLSFVRLAHSGIYSLKLDNTNISAGEYDLLTVAEGIDAEKFTDIVLTTQKGAIIRFWAKSSNPQAGLKIKVAGNVISLEKVATVGEWVMYKGVVANNQLPAGNITVKLVGIASGSTIYIDDFKMQPKTSQTTCYVYDLATLRLTTQFDDQHFGMFYQYNDEGKLVRKLVETEKGLKTIQETQYNSKKKDR